MGRSTRMKAVHQIWLGCPMPAQEQEWTRGVCRAAEAAGWEYRLWGEEDLREEFGAEAMWALYTRAREFLDCAAVHSWASDYYRLRILAEYGGLYLDTDIRCDWWPELPSAADLYGQHEFFAEKICSGWLLAKSPEVMAPVMAAANLRVADYRDDEGGFACRLVEMLRRDKGGITRNGWGPVWLRAHGFPAMARAGYTVGVLPREVAGHVQWRGVRSALTHAGVAHWHEGRKEDQAPLWDARARAAVEFDAAEAAKRREVVATNRPDWLRPQARIALPPQAAMPRQSGGVAAAHAPAPFTLPRGTRRIVVLSNVTAGFNCTEVVRGGDFVIHCNRARHKAAAMAIGGTEHALFVRHGKGADPRGLHWYIPADFDGFRRVLFVDDAQHARSFKWYAEWKRAGGKSPTTGFLVANMCRELWPEVPLVLAGFDPAHGHGTSRWNGHSWNMEAAWYAKKGFKLIAPGKCIGVLVACVSCRAFSGRRQRARDARACRIQRRAWRAACLREVLPATMKAMAYVGRGDTPVEAGTVCLDAPDDYEHLPAKVLAVMRHALGVPGWQWLYKCDDDTFFHAGRLAEFATALPPASPNIYGGTCTAPGVPSGGAGYLLHRETVEKIVARGLPETGAEDVEVSKAVRALGGKAELSPLFSCTTTPQPTKDNAQISAHHLPPRKLAACADACYHL